MVFKRESLPTVGMIKVINEDSIVNKRGNYSVKLDIHKKGVNEFLENHFFFLEGWYKISFWNKVTEWKANSEKWDVNSSLKENIWEIK